MTFLERDPRAVRVIKANLATVGLAERAEVVRGDALAYLASTERRWDVALLDPPYRWDGWDRLWLALPVGGPSWGAMSRRNRPRAGSGSGPDATAAPGSPC
ncbi:MAG: RsmD family RNA methyltransferase [Candidatus Microthrix sp.]|nr:RsmD family RNA methyltransferase [Candidatus Microthrix sp.]